MTEFDELTKVIKDFQKQDIQFNMWQDIVGEKVVVPSLVKGHIQKKGNLFIDFEVLEVEKIIESESLFLFCERLKILIKGRIISISKPGLQIIIEPKFYMHEKRKSYRMNVSDKNIEVKFKRILAQQDREKEEKAQLNDLSNGGCGFFVTANRIVKFQKDNSIVIQYFGKIKVESPISGKVAHITPIQLDHGMNKTVFLVGVKFDRAVSNIDHYLQMLELGMN